MRQLQFKFDPLPTESAEICLFHERWIKTFYTQQFSQLCIKYVLVFYKIDLVQFCNHYLGGPSQKKPPFGHSKNGKWFFRPTKMKTSLDNIVCPKFMSCTVQTNKHCKHPKGKPWHIIYNTRAGCSLPIVSLLNCGPT